MEGKGEFEEYRVETCGWNRGGGLRKSLEGEKEQKAAQQEGCCSHWCSGKQGEGKPGKKRMEDDDGQK